jgi:hypothetical protein
MQRGDGVDGLVAEGDRGIDVPGQRVRASEDPQ